jgi:hypothetical protein
LNSEPNRTDDVKCIYVEVEAMDVENELKVTWWEFEDVFSTGKTSLLVYLSARCNLKTIL